MANVIVNTGSIDLANRVSVRTSGDRVYVFVSQTATILAKKGNQNGEPTSFSTIASLASLTGLVDGSVAGAIDSNNIIHLTWTLVDTSHGGTLEQQYVTFDTSDDTFGSVENVATLDADVSVTEKTGICIDANDEPHVIWRDVFRDMGTDTFSNYYSNRISGVTSGVWNKTRVDVQNHTTDLTSRLFDIMIADPASSENTDLPIIAGASVSSGEMSAYFGNVLDATSFTEATDITGAIGYENVSPISMAIDSNEKITIAFEEITSSDLYIVEHLNSSAWGTWETPVEVSTIACVAPSLAIDGTKRFIFVEEIATNDILLFINKSGTTWTQETACDADLPNVGTFNDVKVKWASKNNNSPTELDYVFDSASGVTYNTFSSIVECRTHTTDSFLRSIIVEIEHTTDSVTKGSHQINTTDGQSTLSGNRNMVSNGSDLYCFKSDVTTGGQALRCWKSTNGGQKWDEQDNANALEENDLGAISSAIDSAGIVYVVFQQFGTSPALTREKRFNTSTDTWVAGTVTINSDTTSIAIGDIVTSLAIDQNDDPHCTFIESNTFRELHYTNKIGGTWKTPVVVDSAGHHDDHDIIFDDRGFPTIFSREISLAQVEVEWGDALNATSFTNFVVSTSVLTKIRGMCKDQDGDIIVTWRQGANQIQSRRHNAGDGLSTWQTAKNIDGTTTPLDRSALAVKGKTFYLMANDTTADTIVLYREINDGGWTKIEEDNDLREQDKGVIQQANMIRWAEFNEPWGEQLDVDYNVSANNFGWHGFYNANNTTHTTDSFLAVGGATVVTEEHTTDSVLKELDNEITHDTDSVLKQLDNEIDHNTDSVLKALDNEITHDTDSVLKELDNEITHDTDSVLREIDNEIAHTTDSFLVSVVTEEHTTDSILKKIDTRTHDTDSVLKELDNEITHTTDSVLVSRQILEHTTDSVLKKIDNEITHDTDSVLKELDNEITHTTDSFLLSVVEIDHDTDSVLKELDNLLTHTTDSILQQIDNEITHTTDSVLKELDNEITHTTDSLLVDTVTRTLTHDTDSVLKKLDNEISHTTDSILREIDNEITHDTDSVLKAIGTTIAHTTDSILKELDNLLTHDTDSVLREIDNEIAHTTDSFLKKIETREHTTDSVLKKLDNLVTHDTDSLLVPEGVDVRTLTHTTDSVLAGGVVQQVSEGGWVDVDRPPRKTEVRHTEVGFEIFGPLKIHKRIEFSIKGKLLRKIIIQLPKIEEIEKVIEKSIKHVKVSFGITGAIKYHVKTKEFSVKGAKDYKKLMKTMLIGIMESDILEDDL